MLCALDRTYHPFALDRMIFQHHALLCPHVGTSLATRVSLLSLSTGEVLTTDAIAILLYQSG